MAQIRFVDMETQLSVPSLNIYHEGGTLIGFTDIEGRLRFLNGTEKYRKAPLTITVQHISYESAKYTLDELSTEQLFELRPRASVIDEIVLDARPREVVVLKGYYRSLETFDLQHKYFSDGIVEFYIPLDGKRGAKYRLLDYRVFHDSAIVNDYNAKMGPFFQIPRLVELDVKKFGKRLENYQTDQSDEHRTRLLRDNIEVGHITSTKETPNIQLYIDMVLPDTVRKEKIFRLEALIKNEVHVENYSSNDIQTASYAQLQSIYQNIVGSIKRKQEYGHVPYEGLNEFYVLERSFVSLEEYKTLEKELTKSIYKTPERSRYQNRFWEELGKYHIPPVQSGLADRLGKELQLVE